MVGYFYFSGLKDFLREIFKNEQLRLQILVGMNADVFNGCIVEYEENLKEQTPIIIKKNFKDSLKKIFVQAAFDRKDFYDDIQGFLELIRSGRLEIRKTREPNHAKLYIFRTLDTYAGLQAGFFITGSSNLSRQGLHDRYEFNVSIKDYGYQQALSYFNELWEKAVIFRPEDMKEVAEIFETQTLIRKISPFEAYLLVLLTYLEAWKKKDISDTLQEKMIKAGFRPFQYQLDAIGQALQILEVHGGVVIADVVGLGKSVIASSIAHELRTRGVVIVPPGLIGADDKSSGWKKYLEDFGLASMGWEVHSLGKLEQVLDIVRNGRDFGAVIIDEAHRFRNEDTQSYALLKEICRNKKVILLTATPFNNRPSDIFALLKLFITPKQSAITFERNLGAAFRHYGYVYDEMLFIKKNLHASKKDKKKAAKIRDLFKKYFQTTEPDLSLVDGKLLELSANIKSVLSPVMIRRNRMDLQKHPLYAGDVRHLSVVADPRKGFYELNKKQSEFYDRVINKYFIPASDGGAFKGAIYLPYRYSPDTGKNKPESAVVDAFDVQFQDNLYELMRRLAVKRFESSFGSFAQTLRNFIRIHRKVLDFVRKTGVYILDRDWINKISDYDEDEFLEEFNRRMEDLEADQKDRKGKILYRLSELGPSFLTDIESDIALFTRVLEELEQLNLLRSDPKADAVMDKILGLRSKDAGRKIIVFTEYRDTVLWLKAYMQKNFSKLAGETLFISGNISGELYETLLKNFDASLPPKNQRNDYAILICTDKLSEGFNLNRAGIIINYDIPWNPVRVIQRLGRINRIGKKVFDELYIMNFFPTERGESIIHQEKIAESKMFMIHNSIGEDAKIFSPDEEPTPSGLFTRLNTNPENLEEESTYTRVFIEFNKYREKYPDIIKNLSRLPLRIKVARQHRNNELITVIRRSNLYFLWHPYGAGSEPLEVPFEKIWPMIRCQPHEEALPLSDLFWHYYERCLSFKPAMPDRYAENSLPVKAKTKLLRLLKEKEFTSYAEFMELLLDDINNYGTLPEYRLRQIASIQTPDDLGQLKNELGEAYLANFARQGNKESESIIISFENQRLQQ